MPDIAPFFDVEEKKILTLVEDLHKALTHLRYEGKLLREQNVKSVQILAYGLDLELEKHRRLQEEVVFPFLQTHIPRHEAAISLLKAEHMEIKSHQQKLKQDILKISSIPDHLQEAKIYEAGIYLVTLIRHHIGLEKKSVDRSMRNELRADEKSCVGKRIEAWLTHNVPDKAAK